MSAAAPAALNIPAKGNDRFFSLDLLSPAIVLAVLIGCLVLMRLPSLVFPYELNVDESQFLSQGMKFLQDPRPWQAVDSNSSGPFNSYAISILLWMGFKANYILAHVLATLLVCLQVLLSYLIFLRIGSRIGALLGATTMVLFYGQTANPDFLHYSSELFPVLSLILGFYSFLVWSQSASLASDPHRQTLVQLLTGLFLGTAPWLKIQASPIAGALAVITLMATLSSRGYSLTVRQRTTQALALCCGVVLPTVGMLAILIACGSLRDFWSSYILSSIARIGPLEPMQLIEHCSHIFAEPHGLLLLDVFGLSLVLFLFSPSRSKAGWLATPAHRWVFGGLFTYMVVALFAVCRSAQEFDHYSQFLVFPVTCLAVVLASDATAWLSGEQAGTPGRRTTLLSILVLGALILLCAGWSLHFESFYRGNPVPDAYVRIADMVGVIQRTRCVKSLAIWGWTPGVYVLTGIPPATRDATGAPVITRGPLQPYFRERFLADLRDSMPDMFIDSATPNAFMWHWTKNDGYESDPELKEFIQENYTLVSELRLVKSARPVRFFAKQPAQHTRRRPPRLHPRPLGDRGNR